MTFRLMLGDNKPYNESAVLKHLASDGTLIMQPKIDGMRAAIDEECKPRTRSGKYHRNRYLAKWAMQHPSLRGIDGEVVSGHQMNAEVFRQSMSGIRSEDGSPEFSFYAFDAFLQPMATWDYPARRAYIAGQIEQLGEEQIGDDYHAKLILCPQILVTSLDEIYAYEEELLVAGWEGAMLRRAHLPYKFNRSTWNGGELMKVKRYEDDEAVIVGFFPWRRNDNEATTDVRGYTTRSAHKDNKVEIERLGGFHCELLRDRSIKFKVGVFRGWTHGDRDEAWKRRDSYLNRILNFKHQGYGGGYDAPRQPVGLTIRDAFEF
jgi:DNA ligase-1